MEEKNRSWCTSSNANDQRAVTIECACTDKAEPYAMHQVVYDRLIDLCEDICNRNGKKKLLWFGDKNKSLNYQPKADEMLITVHRWFANKSCAWRLALCETGRSGCEGYFKTWQRKCGSDSIRDAGRGNFRG